MSAPRIAKGGKALYGARLGILMLEARFPRIPGDVGNALSWPFPVLYKIVRGASPERVVRRRAEGLLPAFVDAARELVADGADGIATNCGFLSLFQAELAAAAQVPVASSPLLQAAWIQRLLPPGRRVGIITIDAACLSPDHLDAAGVPPGTPVVGTDAAGELARAILGDAPTLDVAAARRDLMEAGRRLVEAHPEVGAVLLECTNMPPYARALSEHLGLPVHDAVSFLGWFHAGLAPLGFEGP